MDYEWLKIVGAVAGIGGVSIACVAYIFREIIRKEMFPKLTQKHAYQLLNRIIILIFIIGVLGVLAYVAVSFKNGNAKPGGIETNSSATPTPANQNGNIQNSADNTGANNARSSDNRPVSNKQTSSKDRPVSDINKKSSPQTKPKQTPTPSGIIQETLEKPSDGGQND